MIWLPRIAVLTSVISFGTDFPSSASSASSALAATTVASVRLRKSVFGERSASFAPIAADGLGESRLRRRGSQRRDDDRLDQGAGVDELAVAAVDDPVDDRLRDREPRALVRERAPRPLGEVVGIEASPGAHRGGSRPTSARNAPRTARPIETPRLRTTSGAALPRPRLNQRRPAGALYLSSMGDAVPAASDICVVGGGIVGIATARELAARHPERRRGRARARARARRPTRAAIPAASSTPGSTTRRDR